MFQYSLTGKDGSGSGFGPWKTVPAVPVPLSVLGEKKKRFRRFRFPVPVRFLSHPAILLSRTFVVVVQAPIYSDPNTPSIAAGPLSLRPHLGRSLTSQMVLARGKDDLAFQVDQCQKKITRQELST